MLDYILNDKLPENKNEARSLIYKASNYCVLDNKLFRRSLVEHLLKCLGLEEAKAAILEVHTEICGDHLGEKNLALEIVRQGMFWPTMRKECEDFIKNVNRASSTVRSVIDP